MRIPASCVCHEMFELNVNQNFKYTAHEKNDNTQAFMDHVQTASDIQNSATSHLSFHILYLTLSVA